MPLGVRENEVVLRFRDKETKNRFMGQLSDGWGEGVVQFEWPEGADFDEVEVFIVNTFYDPSNRDNNSNHDWEPFWTDKVAEIFDTDDEMLDTCVEHLKGRRVEGEL